MGACDSCAASWGAPANSAATRHAAPTIEEIAARKQLITSRSINIRMRGEGPRQPADVVTLKLSADRRAGAYLYGVRPGYGKSNRSHDG